VKRRSKRRHNFDKEKRKMSGTEQKVAKEQEEEIRLGRREPILI
jgi:hypothetical protein